jgi:hypothetical protein
MLLLLVLEELLVQTAVFLYWLQSHLLVAVLVGKLM